MNMFGSGRTVADVAVDITVECVDQAGQRHEIDTVLGYRRTDPYAVSMTFVTGDGSLVWTFGRNLLSRGTISPTGEGDVSVFPGIGEHGRAVINIELSSPDGHLLLEAKAENIAEFLNRTTEVVPEGSESDHLDVDQLIADLLAS